MTSISEQTITDTISRLSVPSRLGEKTSLEPIAALLERMGNPERKFRSIHVGGTSGKGSTSTYLANILTGAGYKVGLFTKPHLVSVRERFMIDGEPILPEAILALLENLEKQIDSKPTWFELTTALAFQYFAGQQVDYAVIEVGLGGMLDATNVILPEMSLLTNVGLDHTDILGDTVEEIAADKVGIIKPGKPVISGAAQPSVIQIIEKRCAQVHAPLRLAGRDFTCTHLTIGTGGSRFDYESESETLRGLAISMAGRHQVANASLAVAAALWLRETGASIPEQALRAALLETRVPGRMEILEPGSKDCLGSKDRPVVLLDGAHSPPKMEALAEGLRALYAEKRRIIAVLSFSKGHDALSSLVSLAPLLDAAVLTEFTAETDYGNKRAQDRREVAAALRSLNPGVQTFLEPDPVQAIQMAQSMAGPHDLICVTGSIFLVGQIRHFLTTVHGDNCVPDPTQANIE